MLSVSPLNPLAVSVLVLVRNIGRLFHSSHALALCNYLASFKLVLTVISKDGVLITVILHYLL